MLANARRLGGLTACVPPAARHRRDLLRGAAGLLAAVGLPGRRARAAGRTGGEGPARLFDLRAALAAPVTIESLEVLKAPPDRWLVRARARDGSVGFAVPNQHAPYLVPMFRQRVAPFFAGKDARDLEALIDGVHVDNSNYKLVGLPFWTCVSWAEFALLDLLGRLAGKPVGELLGGKLVRRRVPMYISSTDRETTPEQEVARFEEALARTGARAVKFKVGGRMSRNEDAAPGRTEALIALARKRLGSGVTLYADANGSFDVRKGIEVGRMLEAHGVAIYEEPCPFEDYEATRLVTRALKRITVAGGEQDTSWYRFREIVRNRVLDLVQPDLSYNGGFVRTTRVARLAAAAGLPISPHCPQASTMLYTLHLAGYTPNMGAFQEFHLRLVGRTQWFAPDLQIADGTLAVPTAPGLGLTIEPAVASKAVAA